MAREEFWYCSKIFLLFFILNSAVSELPMFECGDDIVKTGQGNTDPPTDQTKTLIGQKLTAKAKSFKSKASKVAEFFQSDGSFSDIEYDEEKNEKWAREHSQRVGWFVYDQILINENNNNQDFMLPMNITVAYEYMLKVPRKNLEYSSNRHWVSVIAAPLAMYAGLVLADKKLSYNDTVGENLMNRLLDRFFVDTDYGAVWNMTCRYDKNSGGNFGPRVIAALAEAYLRDNLQTFVDELKVRLREELVTRIPFQGNGFIWDGCLHQHNMIIPSHHQNGTGLEKLKLIYGAAYGKEFLKHLASVAYILDGTQYELDNELKNGLFDAFFECHQWLYRGRSSDPSSLGRFVDEEARMTHSSTMDSIYKPMLELKKMNFRTFEVNRAIHRYKNPRPSSEYVLKGNRNFFVSDMMAHHRQDYMATLRMTSIRTCRPETKPDRNETKSGYFLGDGFMTLVLSDELGTKNNQLFQAYNWTRVPGVTCPFTNNVTQKQLSPKNLVHSYNNHKFVGGVSDLEVGLAAMVYARPTIQITAKKSYAFFDKVILAMGSGIKKLSGLEKGRYVGTTLNQVPYDGSYSGGRGDSLKTISDPTDPHREWSSDLTADTFQWLNHKNVGYISIKSEGRLISSVEKQHDFITKDVFSAWIDHGTLVDGPASYSYVIYPNATVEQTKQYAKTPYVEVRSLTENVHDACDTSTKIQAVALFKEGCFSIKECLGLDAATSAEICSDKPILALAQLSTESKCDSIIQVSSTLSKIVQVHIGDPTHELENIGITLHLNSADILDEGSFALPAGNLKGSTMAICYQI